MRRTVTILAIAALLFGSAAYGLKKSRESTVSATPHKRELHSAKHSAHREAGHRPSSARTMRARHVAKAMPAVFVGPTQETAPVVASASLRKSHLVMPSPLRGSYDSLVRQNEKSEETDGLERIEDEADLNDRIASGMLVPVPVSAELSVNLSLPENRRYCRPWTASFLKDLARAHSAQFRSPLLVTSAVRTVEYQKQLERVNGNAAAAEGDIASPHLTGATIDIAKQGLSRQQIAWMRSRLLALQEAGKIDVEEEFRQACFHITVYKSYVPAAPESTTPTQTAATPIQAVQSRTGKSSPKPLKSSHRRPAQAIPQLPRREEPEQQPAAPVAQPDTPVEG